MPRKRGKYYKIKITLEGYGTIAEISTKTTNPKTALMMEEAIREIHEKTFYDSRYISVLDGLRPVKKGGRAKITPAMVLNAVKSRTPEILLLDLSNPTISELINRFSESQTPDKSTQYGFTYLLSHFKPETRISVLTVPSNIEKFYKALECGEITGRKNNRNSVLRRAGTAVSHLLRFQFGESRRDEIIKEVRYKGFDDTRLVSLTNAEFWEIFYALKKRIVKPLDKEIHVVAYISVVTGCTYTDLGETPKKNVTLHNIDGETWAEIRLKGTKKLSKGDRANRDRTILFKIIDEISYFNEMMTNEGEFISMCPHTRFAFIFQKIRNQLGFNHIRANDLRSVFSHKAEEAGVPFTLIQNQLGHSNPQITAKYLNRKSALDFDAMRKIQAQLEK